MADCGCRIKNLPYTDADVAPASIVQCPLHANAGSLRDALVSIRDRSYAEEYHDGSSTGPAAIRELQEIARAVLADTKEK